MKRNCIFIFILCLIASIPLYAQDTSRTAVPDSLVEKQKHVQLYLTGETRLLTHFFKYYRPGAGFGAGFNWKERNFAGIHVSRFYSPELQFTTALRNLSQDTMYFAPVQYNFSQKIWQFTIRYHRYLGKIHWLKNSARYAGAGLSFTHYAISGEVFTTSNLSEFSTGFYTGQTNEAAVSLLIITGADLELKKGKLFFELTMDAPLHVWQKQITPYRRDIFMFGGNVGYRLLLGKK